MVDDMIWVHEASGSSPDTWTNKTLQWGSSSLLRLRCECVSTTLYAYVAQMVRAVGSYPTGQWFDSTRRYHENLIFLEIFGIIFIQR